MLPYKLIDSVLLGLNNMYISLTLHRINIAEKIAISNKYNTYIPSILDGIKLIKFLNGINVEFAYKAIDWSAYHGNLNVVKWLHYNRNEVCTTLAMNGAAENGYLDMVIWLHNNRNEGCTTYAMDSAAKNGHLEVLKWLHYNRNEGCTTQAMDWAAYKGHMHIIRWLHENRNEGCTYDAIAWAAVKEHTYILKWLCINKKEYIDINRYIEIMNINKYDRTYSKANIYLHNL